MASGEDEGPQYSNFARVAASHLDKFERYDSQELLYYGSTHWLLSGDLYRTAPDPDSILAYDSPDCTAVILFPVRNDMPPLCYREIHTIIRELTMGMYVFNQTPAICLDANFDQATVCNFPPAYIDTMVGQLLTNVDYMLKGLWHGAYFPREKRIKFNERWRGNLDVNLLGKPETKKPLVAEFLSAGLIDVTIDPDYAKMYDRLPADIPDDSEMEEERKFFMSCVDSLSLRLTFSSEEIQNFNNLYVCRSKYNVSSIVRLMDNQLDQDGYERLKTRLQMHEDLIQEHLADKQEVRKQLELVKLISCLVNLFVRMRRSWRIPDIYKLLPSYTGDECRTEREFPPLIVGRDFKCKNFLYTGQYFHLHGGIDFDLDADSMRNASQAFCDEYESVMKRAETEFYNHLYQEQPVKEHYHIPICTIAGKSYYAFMMELDTFSGSSPQKPIWLRAFHDEMDKMRPKRLPIADVNMHEQFKKCFGFKKAIKFKTPVAGVKVCAQRSFVSMYAVLCRKVSASRLFKHDEQGLSLIHHAAIYNHPYILIRMLMSPMDINLRRNNFLAAEYKKATMQLRASSASSTIVLPKVANSLSEKHSDGPTALHLAARCGSLNTVFCLCSKSANIFATDHDGWAPIHYAAYFDHFAIIRAMVRKYDDLLELLTKNTLMSTPLLLAASSGALSVVKYLVKQDADLEARDTDDNNVITLAALRFHTNVLQYFIELANPLVPVWNILVEMLLSEEFNDKDSAVKCLEVLSAYNPHYWKNIHSAGGVPALVSLLQLDTEEIQSMALSVLCNTADNESVKLSLSKTGVVPVLIKLLSSSNKEVQTKAAIILSDIARIGDNQRLIAENGGIMPLVVLLQYDEEDILVNSVNAIRVLCLDNVDNQKMLAQCRGLDPLVELLETPSEDIQVGTAAALSAATFKNTSNQDYVISKNAHRPLVDLIKHSKSTIVQVKAAKALEALAMNNVKSQNRFLEIDAPKALIRLLKNIHVEVREQGAYSLWALAGNTRTQQKYIAERISIAHISQMLLEPTEKLLYVGCMTTIALAMEDMPNQNRLADHDAIPQLVSLMRSSKTSQKVLHMVIKVIGILCVGMAYRNNQLTQKKIAEEGGIPVLAFLFKNAQSEEMTVELAITLGCVTLSSKENQLLLAEDRRFSFDEVPCLMSIKDQELRLKAGMALTIFSFNNTARQNILKNTKSIKYSMFIKFLQSPDEFYQCYAAFQIVVLGGAIVDKDQIQMTAEGIKLLMSKIHSDEEKIVVLACNLLSALSHTRAGLADAMVSIGLLDLLVKKLSSTNIMVRNGAAVALGYLTFNKTAYRLLFSVCRNIPGLFKKIMDNIGEYPRISADFVRDYTRAETVGLPSLFMESNGGRPVAVQKVTYKKYR